MQGKGIIRLASITKLKAGCLSREVSDDCPQYLGGMGHLWETPLARIWRDNRLQSLGRGADEVMLRAIAKIERLAPGSWPASR